MNDREAFEAWHQEKFPNSLEKWMSRSEPYVDKEVQARFEVWQAALASQVQQEPVKTKHHTICDGRYPSLCDACNAEAQAQPDHIGDSNKLVQSHAKQEPESPTNEEKALAWFNALQKIATRLGMPDDQPIIEAVDVLEKILSHGNQRDQTIGSEIKVTSQGVSFGKYCWYSHERITGYEAERLNRGDCNLTASQYMEWVQASLPSDSEGVKP